MAIEIDHAEGLQRESARPETAPPETWGEVLRLLGRMALGGVVAGLAVMAIALFFANYSDPAIAPCPPHGECPVNP